MTSLHTWRRWFENRYRWDTAAEQAILDSQDDLLLEIQELRYAMTELATPPKSNPYGLDPIFTLGMSDEQMRHIKYILDVLEES